MKLKCLVFVLLFILLLIPEKVSAQTKAIDDNLKQNEEIISQTSLGIDPAIVEIVLDESKASKREVRLSNLTNYAIPIKTTKRSFTIEERQKLPKEVLEKFDASSWINISDDDTDFILQPKEIKNIELEMIQPKDASPGGHYATIYFQPLIPTELVNEKSVFVYARVAVLVFMQVKGDIVENLDIKGFNTNLFHDSPPISIDLTLNNSGNTHLMPKTSITIQNEINKEVIAKLNPNLTLVLPYLDRTFSNVISEELPIGIYSAIGEVTFGSENKYISTEKITFIVMPYKVTGIVIILTIFALLFRKRLRKALRVLVLDKPTGTKSLEKKLNFNLEKK